MKLFEVKANRKLLEININKNSVRSSIVDIEEFEHQSLTFQEAVRHVRREMGSNHYGNFIHSFKTGSTECGLCWGDDGLGVHAPDRKTDDPS